MVIIGHHHGLAAGHHLAGVLILDLVLEAQALIAEACHAHPDEDALTECDRGSIPYMYIRYYQSQIQERIPIPQAKLDQVSQARLLGVAQITSVIDVTLCVQITISDLDRAVQTEPWHIGIIHFSKNKILSCYWEVKRSQNAQENRFG